MIKKNKIYNVDCIDWMKSTPKEIDLILTSPPYNTARTGTNQRSFDNYENRYDIHLDNKTDKEYLEWSVDLFNGYNSILKSNGCVLYNISYSSENTDLIWKFIAEIINNTLFTVADTIVWKKDCAIPNNTSHNKLTRICEFVFVFVRKAELNTFKMNKKITSISKTGQKFYENKFNYIKAKNNDGSNNLNKATFSTDFCRQLLIMYGHKNCLVYDSFMGTGTTAESCIIEDMNYVGTELSESQCRFAEKRLGIRISQPTLF
jgi:adenine-specific DNA-methyltransferase